MRNTFSKAERLCSQPIIDQLFKSGQTLAQHPIRLVWIEAELPSPYPVQVAISVPKKKFKRAVDRNRIKRQIKEAYRTHKHDLYNQLNGTEKQIALMILYTSNQAIEFDQIKEKIIVTLQRLSDRYGSIDR